MCPMQYFIEYNLGHRSPSNKKADKGTIVHKVLEILAFVKLNIQNNNRYFEDDIIGPVDITNYSLDHMIEQVYGYYTSQFTHHKWTDRDYKDCTNGFIKLLNMVMACSTQEIEKIVEPEQHFDITIDKDWAKYSYDTKEGHLEGQLSIKGTIDLITKVNDNTYEVIDWKTGRRLDWATGQEKTLKKLHNDAQLMLYYYAVHKLYPDIENIMVSIDFINDGGMFSVCFNKDNLYQVEMMLKRKFEAIRDTTNPPLNKSWKCTKLCHFGKTTFENSEYLPIVEYREGQLINMGETMTKCEQIKHDINIKGMNNVIDQYQAPGYNIGHYKAPGSAE